MYAPGEFHRNCKYVRFLVQGYSSHNLTFSKNQDKLFTFSHFIFVHDLFRSPDTWGNYMTDFESLLQKAKDFHGEICAGIILGSRMTIIGMRELTG